MAQMDGAPIEYTKQAQDIDWRDRPNDQNGWHFSAQVNYRNQPSYFGGDIWQECEPYKPQQEDIIINIRH